MDFRRYASELPSLVLALLLSRSATPPHQLDASEGDRVVHDAGFVFGFRGLHPLLPALNFLVAIWVFALYVEAKARCPPPPRSLVFASFTACLAGCLLRLWAKTELGRLFTYQVGIREGHTIVSTGPYALLLHPSYTGLWLAALGGSTYFLGTVWTGWVRLVAEWAIRLGLARGDPRVLAERIAGVLAERGPLYLGLQLAAAVYFTSRRIEVEERTLRDHFGPEKWDAHAAGRWRMVPWIY
ncbi:hypothetical protein DFJ74DRAFT_671667 [Hyaloraphidium curvatum]|nr:hypothetical protein DFJ74DRAFT_671667 [Hyaloraphidium curvatum]